MATYTFLFDPAAANEYEEAFAWYEAKSTMAADGFIIEVQEAIEIACAHPVRYRNTYKNLRELTLKKYPFNLIYYINEPVKQIVIVSIYHHKRNPKWKYKKPGKDSVE